MQVAILAFVLVFVATGCSSSTSPPSATDSKAIPVGASPNAAPHADAQKSLAAAATWLWSRQAADGGWHSDTYKLLGSGQALTPLVLHSLLTVPRDVHAPDPERLRRGLEFLRRSVGEDGGVGMADPGVPEYPNYATALAILCLVQAGQPADKPLIERMARHLAAEQYGEARGFKPAQLAYGGWGFGGPLPLGGSPGHMDIAHTRHALAALRAAGGFALDAAALRRAEMFLRLMQRHPQETRPQPSEAGQPRPVGWRPPYDGGFYFSPVVLAANKGREGLHDGQPYFRSYASATCEGALALLAAGVSPEDERIKGAQQWLAEHPRLDYPEGIPTDLPEPWGESIYYYHLAVRARCYAALRWPGDWRREMALVIVARQRSDGSFRNDDSHLMKEDDPLLATALAVAALGECERGGDFRGVAPAGSPRG